MSENHVRNAIGAALKYPLADEAFDLVDAIESNVRDGEPGGELHEVAAEISSRLVETLSTRQTAILWAVLNADGEALETYGPVDHDTTLALIQADLFVVVERAVFAALEAFVEEAGR
jgi:hypothetical protein